MKKVLLATTILGMTAGFAAAEIAFTGEATAGFAQVNGNPIDTYTSFKLAVAATGESDSGLSFGASFDATAGVPFDFDGAGSSFENGKTGAFGQPTVFVSGDFGKLAFKLDGFDDYHDDAFEDHDVEYTHTIAGFNVGVRTDLDGGESSLKLGYKAGAIALGANFDQSTSAWDISAAYTLNALTFTLGTDNDSETSLKVAYKADGISGSLKVTTSDEWDLEAGYTANALTLGAKLDEASAWELKGSYNLGGGLSVEGGLHSSESAFLGAKMKF